MRATRQLVVAATIATAAAFASMAGCAVSESDVHRWETTEGGPEKLYALVTHDKYAPALREEAALSLIHMRPRNGKRSGSNTSSSGTTPRKAGCRVLCRSYPTTPGSESSMTSPRSSWI